MRAPTWSQSASRARKLNPKERNLGLTAALGLLILSSKTNISGTNRVLDPDPHFFVVLDPDRQLFEVGI